MFVAVMDHLHSDQFTISAKADPQGKLRDEGTILYCGLGYVEGIEQQCDDVKLQEIANKLNACLNCVKLNNIRAWASWMCLVHIKGFTEV